jgi:uncharacterized protein YbbK (DUF523 family)
VASSHLPTASQIEAWPIFTVEAPLRVLVSGWLAGRPCGADGTSYGEHPLARRLLDLPNVRAVPFCPEEDSFGTPRATPDIHGGDGFDVLDGRARVLSDAGDDWTGAMVRSALKMKEIADQQGVRLALLMDVSAACGSTVIYDGARRLQVYRRGPQGAPIGAEPPRRTSSLRAGRICSLLERPASDAVMNWGMREPG